MAARNTSAAYSFSTFETRPKEKKQPEAPKLKVVKNHNRLSLSILSPHALSAFAIVIALVSLMVYNQVQLTELTAEISTLTSEMDVLESDNTKMASALESTISLHKVAEMARAMGMQPRDEYQTERIYLYHEDKIERTEATPELSTFEKAKLSVTSFLHSLKEYLAGE